MRMPATPRALTCVLAVSSILTTGALASAQPAKKGREIDAASAPAPLAESEARVERAKELYEQAAAAYAARKNFEAIELFRQSGALEPSPLLSYNMALAYEEAGDLRNALKYFREYASAAGQDDAAEVQARISKLESKLGKLGIQQLTVRSNPSGATLSVDGVPVGVTPYTAEFPPGAHTLEVSMPGYAETEASIDLPADRAVSVALTLREAKAPAAPPPQLPPAAPPPPRDDRSAFERIEPLSWGLMGVGVGALTAGIAFEFSRAGSAEDARAADDPIEAAEAEGAADSKRLTSVLLLGAGGAFTITGAVLAILDVSHGRTPEPARQASQKRRPNAALSLSREFQGVRVTGSF
ncbi:MAG TPA: PEGA domain-containing protein [Polyangiaceae bacterium]|nr:PEGA domain-containing protein [Polyangiaceae bacterium]